MIRRTDARGSAPLGTVIAVFVAGALVGAVAAVEVVPANRLPQAAAGNNGTLTSNGGPATTTNNGGPQATASGAPGTNTNQPGTNVPGQQVLPPSQFECRPGKNGGVTDRGVTATSINLATTIVATDLGSAFLGEMQYAMKAVADQVNRSGGICGRMLTIQTRNDRWDPSLGSQFLGNYLGDRSIFGIPVGASSEGLEVVIKRNDLTNNKFPAVGTDGLAIAQYETANHTAQPWVWPIATATVSSARIMADEAYKAGARKMGVVFDSNYKFGEEAAAAFSNEVDRLQHNGGVPGHNNNGSCVKMYCGIKAGQNSYSGSAANFYNEKPDFVALFLEPETALTWMQDSNTPAANAFDKIKYGYGGAQPLFTNQFETQCADKCDQMVVWSAFKPDVERYANDPAVQTYVKTLLGKNPQADPYNQFTESAYVGMQFFVAALRKVGPDLTRDRLKVVLDNMTYTDPLTLQGTLTFSPTTRFANVTMQAFTMQFKGSPGGWRLGVIARDHLARGD